VEAVVTGGGGLGSRCNADSVVGAAQVAGGGLSEIFPAFGALGVVKPDLVRAGQRRRSPIIALGAMLLLR
jgi:hypothetical protein